MERPFLGWNLSDRGREGVQIENPLPEELWGLLAPGNMHQVVLMDDSTRFGRQPFGRMEMAYRAMNELG